MSGGGGVDASKACRLESPPSISVHRLGNALEVDEAKRLELDKMKLKFDGEAEEEEGRRKNEDNQLVLEALQPPLNF